MANLDILTYGFALESDQGSFGWSTISLLTVGERRMLIDTGPASRRTNLLKALANHSLEPEDIDTVTSPTSTGTTVRTRTCPRTRGSWSTRRSSTMPETRIPETEARHGR